MESTAAGVVQHTKSTTMEMRTTTNMRSSGLCSERFLWRRCRRRRTFVAGLLCGSWAGLPSAEPTDEGSGEGDRLQTGVSIPPPALAPPGTSRRGPEDDEQLVEGPEELDWLVLLVLREGKGEEGVECWPA